MFKYFEYKEVFVIFEEKSDKVCIEMCNGFKVGCNDFCLCGLGKKYK